MITGMVITQIERGMAETAHSTIQPCVMHLEM